MVEGVTCEEMIREIAISPLLPSAEANAIKATLRKILSEHTHVQIRRSNLLGDHPEWKEVDDRLTPVLEPLCEEPDLPAIFKIL